MCILWDGYIQGYDTRIGYEEDDDGLCQVDIILDGSSGFRQSHMKNRMKDRIR